MHPGSLSEGAVSIADSKICFGVRKRLRIWGPLRGDGGLGFCYLSSHFQGVTKNVYIILTKS